MTNQSDLRQRAEHIGRLLDQRDDLTADIKAAFEAMMKTSLNQHLYAGALARRITGERD